MIGSVQDQLTTLAVAILAHAIKTDAAEMVSVRSASGHWAHWETHPGDADWVDMSTPERGAA